MHFSGVKLQGKVHHPCMRRYQLTSSLGYIGLWQSSIQSGSKPYSDPGSQHLPRIPEPTHPQDLQNFNEFAPRVRLDLTPNPKLPKQSPVSPNLRGPTPHAQYSYRLWNPKSQPSTLLLSPKPLEPTALTPKLLTLKEPYILIIKAPYITPLL